MKHISLLLMASVFAFASCTDLKKTEQFEKIDALNSSLDSISEVYYSNKIDTLRNLSMSIYGVQNRIKNNYVSDTVNFKLGVKMGKHKWMKKKLKVIGKNGKVLDSGIVQMKTTLQDLRHDIDNGYGEREKYDEHIAHERRKVNQLRVVCDEYVVLKDSCMTIYNSVQDELNAFSMSLIEK